MLKKKNKNTRASMKSLASGIAERKLDGIKEPIPGLRVKGVFQKEREEKEEK